jgi:hypothetical protein
MISTLRHHASSGSALLALVVAAFGGGCTDAGKKSQKAAEANVAYLATVVEKDVGEIETGLPKGAAMLATLYAKGADPKQNLASVKPALVRIRHAVPDLNVAKSTFFALLDSEGVAIRNDLDTDAMAGKNVKDSFPDLGKVDGGELVVTAGRFVGPDGESGKSWMAAIGVKDETGKVAGTLLTGWPYRTFTRHLTEMLRRKLQEESGADQGKKMPVFYVAIFDAEGVHAAPTTPEVNVQALKELGLTGKTANGPLSGTLSITGRDFGWAAQRAPKLAKDAGIVVLRSEI